jgi:hypothetical protein
LQLFFLASFSPNQFTFAVAVVRTKVEREPSVANILII